jgi:hypothetical protein
MPSQRYNIKSNTVYDVWDNRAAEQMLHEEMKRQRQQADADRLEMLQQKLKQERDNQVLDSVAQRLIQLESQLSIVTHRLSMAEAEVRRAKGREQKLLTIIHSMVWHKDITHYYDILQELIKEIQDGQED